MKKLSLILGLAALLLTAHPASAQWTGGFGYSQFTHVGSERILEESIPGFFFGVGHDFAISSLDGLSFETGVFFYHYGKTFSYLGGGEKEYRANFFSIPLNIKYTMSGALGPDLDLTAFTGPRITLAGLGNMYHRGDGEVGMKRGDAQWGFGLAATFSEAVQLRVGYDFGLSKEVKIKNLTRDPKIFRNSLNAGIFFLF